MNALLAFKRALIHAQLVRLLNAKRLAAIWQSARSAWAPFLVRNKKMFVKDPCFYGSTDPSIKDHDDEFIGVDFLYLGYDRLMLPVFIFSGHGVERSILMAHSRICADKHQDQRTLNLVMKGCGSTARGGVHPPKSGFVLERQPEREPFDVLHCGGCQSQSFREFFFKIFLHLRLIIRIFCVGLDSSTAMTHQ